MSQTRLITTRVDEALAEKIEQAAAGERRAVSALVRNILSDALTKPQQPNSNPEPQVTA